MIERAKRGLSEMMPDEVRELDRQLTQRLEDKYGRENVEKAVKLIESTAIAAIVATNPELAVAKAMVEAYTGRDMLTNQPLTLAEKADRFAQAIPGYSALRSTFEVTSGYRLTDFEKLSPQERLAAGVTVAGAVASETIGSLGRGSSEFRRAAVESGAKVEDAAAAEARAVSGASAATAPATPQNAVIGRMDDLNAPGALRPGEYRIADKLPNLGSPKANYYQNMSVLREEMRRGVPIRDVSAAKPDSFLVPTPDNPGRTIRQTFTGAERNLLSNRGWTFDGEYWNPPRE